MSKFIDKIRSWLPSRGEKRAIAGESNWVINPTLAGVIVDEHTAPTFAAVYAAINILSSDVGCFPFNVMKKGKDNDRVIDESQPVQDIVHVEPNEELGTIGLYGSMMWHLLTTGNTYLEIERERFTLQPVAVHLLDPDRVHIKRTPDKDLYYLVEDERRLPRDIVHVAAIGRDGLIGKSPIQLCREEIGLGMATVKFGAARFGNGISECGAITFPDTMDELETKAFRAGINREHQGPYNANKFLLLQGGATFARTSISAEDAQFLGTRKFNVEEICRIFRIPPTKLMNFDKASFSNIEETNLDYYLSSLAPWLRRIEGELNRKLFTRAERRIWTIEHDESYTLRGRIVDQAAVDKVYRDMGVLSTNEIRGRRGWGKVAGGDVRFVPLNMAPLEAVAKATLAELKGVKPDVTLENKEADSPDPTAKPEVPVDDVQAAALNGAQISSMVEIVQKVAAGELPVESAKGLIAACFPTLTDAQIKTIFKSLKGFTPPAEDKPAEADPEPDPAVDAVRSVVLDTARRMAKREANALRSIAKKSDLAELISALENHYGRETETLTGAYSPCLRAYSAVLKRPIDVQALASSIVEASRAEILTCIEGPGTSLALVALADRWDAGKADQILSDLESRHETQAA
jgi:HK97 family phage portal protein